MNISKINSVSYVTRNNIGYNVGNDNRVENNNENNLNKNISFGNAINFRIALSKLKGYNGNIQDYLMNVVGKYSKNRKRNNSLQPSNLTLDRHFSHKKLNIYNYRKKLVNY